MKKAKLTPWFAHKHYVTDKESFSIAEDGSRHGETPNWCIDAGTVEAALLVAAAPAMFELLTILNDFIHDILIEAQEQGREASFQEALCAARLSTEFTIAKATRKI